ncbi:MAG: right-handed parallel beta-helix repeat-containing protein [Hyphomicrobiales bacterium]|nr:right-handed parallel beta-helix repeat-containing protein [Hyphomicrobiales bacterium]
MMMDKRLHALLFAGFFCLVAALGGVQAAEVYPGCGVPPTTFNRVWYIDPVNGKTPADGGNGSQSAPWNSLQGVVGSTKQSGYNYPMLSTVAYDHYPKKNAQGARFYADGPSSGPTRVQPGDEILLMGGQYGDVSIAWAAPTTNSAFVTIAAAPGQTPVLSTLLLSASSYFVFSGIKIQSMADGAPRPLGSLVYVGDQRSAGPSSNIVFTNMLVSSADDPSAWTKAQWLARIRTYGISIRGDDTTCVSVTNSHISNVIFGSMIWANNTLFSSNEIDHFGDDGIDYRASNILMTKNYIHDDLDLGNGAHMDGMQGYPGAFSNVVIDSNRIIRQTDPKLPFPNYLQGIDAFDGDWTNLTVTNNVVVTSACWGIGYGSVHGGKIINNTVIADNLFPMPGNCKPGVTVVEKTHQGSPSNDVIIRNNIASGLSIYNVNPDMTMDHNICLAINGKCGILTYSSELFGGKPRPIVDKPGDYADHNIVDRRGADGTFINFDPDKLVYDLRLKPEARAIGAGNPADAPPVDITGAWRGSRIDAGAYQYAPLK